MLVRMEGSAWRVAITRDEDVDGPWHLALTEAGFEPVSCPVSHEGPPPDPDRLRSIAQNLAAFDWVFCSSARSVRALVDAGATEWPTPPRYAAVGTVTAAAMRAAGAPPSTVIGTGGAKQLWEQVRDQADWRATSALVATVPGGRRELIDGLRAAGARVEEVECYTMRARDAAAISRDWHAGRPDAVLLASPSAARLIAAAVGVDVLRGLKAVVPIGHTTAAALAAEGIRADPPDTTTFEAVVERLVTLRGGG